MQANADPTATSAGAGLIGPAWGTYELYGVVSGRTAGGTGNLGVFDS
jgi:hypothetical protein